MQYRMKTNPGLAALILGLCLLNPTAAVAAKTEADMVDYFTDNGLGNAVGPPAGGKTFERGESYFDAKSGNLLISKFIKNAQPEARLLVARLEGGTDFRRIYLVDDNGPLQRERSEAKLLTKEQKAMPPVKKSK